MLPASPRHDEGVPPDVSRAQRDEIVDSLRRQLNESQARERHLKKQIAGLRIQRVTGGTSSEDTTPTLCPPGKRLERTLPRSSSETINVQPCSRDFGHALPKLMGVLQARCLIVSTPERGPGPGDTVGECKCHVMASLERVATLVFPNLQWCYDFKGSAAAKDCGAQVPDCGLSPTDWAEPSKVQTTQWFRYWMGRVRSALLSLLQSAEPLLHEIDIDDLTGTGGGIRIAQGSRTVFAISISGGAISRTEKAALPNLINGTVSDLSARTLDIGSVRIEWLHFETVDDFIKAMQGIGGIDFAGAAYHCKSFDQPGRWTDGAYNSQFDLLQDVHGNSPEEVRRNILLTSNILPQAQLDKQLENAIRAKWPQRVRELLGLSTENKQLENVSRESFANPNARHPANGDPMFNYAASKFNVEAMKSLLAANADPCETNHSGVCALEKAIQYELKIPVDAGAVAFERVQQTIELCAVSQLGMPFIKHTNRLVAGVVVTWTHQSMVVEQDVLVRPHVGTILGFQIPLLNFIIVEGVSGETAAFGPAQLRLTSYCDHSGDKSCVRLAHVDEATGLLCDSCALDIAPGSTRLVCNTCKYNMCLECAAQHK